MPPRRAVPVPRRDPGLGREPSAPLRGEPSWQSPTAFVHEASSLLRAPAVDDWNVLAPGRGNSCVTDRLSLINEVIEWKPFERPVVEVEAPEASLHELALEPADPGTLATIRW